MFNGLTYLTHIIDASKINDEIILQVEMAEAPCYDIRVVNLHLHPDVIDKLKEVLICST